MIVQITPSARSRQSPLSPVYVGAHLPEGHNDDWRLPLPFRQCWARNPQPSILSLLNTFEFEACPAWTPLGYPGFAMIAYPPGGIRHPRLRVWGPAGILMTRPFLCSYND